MSQPAYKKDYNRSPFLPENTEMYKNWRDEKLKDYPQTIGELFVEINDPRKLTDGEFEQIQKLCKKTNMALYAGKTGTDPDPEIPLSMGRRFGLTGLNDNWLADKETGLTSLTVREDGIRKDYIPYTNRAINWHTDGYYNTAHKQIHALNLHVVHQAASGGENALMDHEIAYILLREKNPEYISALMGSGVMTIPARIEDGKIARREEAGPVFSVTDSGDLHMRYTIRVNNVIWTNDPVAQEALKYLQEILYGKSPYIYKGRLEPGMGLVSNNVIHDRAAFKDDATHKRHYYRARYFDRLAGTGIF
ncbi:MAG: TauD/TfdA family dioxygenase [Spirochaetia bacterium]|nr:TauD/TfdA family dioxygenase [Spirochaetia bacterium]